jgi:putative radical SAM enzyme (TIGR03279 family)
MRDMANGAYGLPVAPMLWLLMSNPTILEVLPGSPAAAAGLQPGDELLSVNGVVPTDVIEYQQLVDESAVGLEVRRDGAASALQIVKSAGAPLGLRLNSSIFDRVQTCDNHCEFCFIYQLPPGMRTTLYLKDDDYRLSFLYGNFTTLTRFTELDLSRVVEERLGPLYVSIHATDPEVRAGMLRNPRGATSLRWLRALLENGVEVHGQIVLCPGVNSGAVLERTCAEIITTYPELASVGIVPLGLSKHGRETTLVTHTAETAADDIEIISFWQERAFDALDKRMFFASDELYLVAGAPVPPADEYEGFDQHENGIGMIRSFYDELDQVEAGLLASFPTMTGNWSTIPAAPAEGYREVRPESRGAGTDADGPVVIVTGDYGARVFENVLERLEALTGTQLRVLPVANEFFGGNVAVAGLMVGGDIQSAIAADRLPARRYLVPNTAVPGGRFLDDMDIETVATATIVPIDVVAPTVAGLIEGASV